MVVAIGGVLLTLLVAIERLMRIIVILGLIQPVLNECLLHGHNTKCLPFLPLVFLKHEQLHWLCCQ